MNTPKPSNLNGYNPNGKLGIVFTIVVLAFICLGLLVINIGKWPYETMEVVALSLINLIGIILGYLFGKKHGEIHFKKYLENLEKLVQHLVTKDK